MGGEMRLTVGYEPWDIMLDRSDNDKGKRYQDQLRIVGDDNDKRRVDIFVNNVLIWSSVDAFEEQVKVHLRAALRLLGG